ncbi:MBG domain-containing protein [Pediococcus cellicola]|uniref:MBG domain-containing protein n=1 Tax=Pediococcus cellicola TaxID=319652 RepID=UPI00360EF409
MIQSSSSAASASTAVSETSSTANASETSSSTIVASSAEASSASASETSADVSQATSAESSTTTSAPKSAASSSSSAAVSAVTSQTSSSQTSSVATSSVSSVASSESTGTSALGTKATKNSTVSSSAVSTRAAVANSSAASTSTVEKVTTLNSDALTNLQNELPTGSVVTTQADGTVVIALAVGADEKAVKALVANSDLNSAVVITAKDANVVVPNLNSTTSINKAGEVYTGSSSTVAGDFTAAGTATVPNSSGSSSLTTATNNQSGYLVLNNQLNFSSSFTMSGTVVLGNSSDGADGLTFVFSPSNPSQLTTSGTGGNLGLGGLPNSFGLAIDEYYNTAFGDFDNANALPWQIMKPAAGTISWRTTDSSGKLNTNTRVGDGGIFSNVGNVSAQDTTSQVVSINRGIMDGRAHAFTISYNAATSVLTITLPDNNSGSNQVYGRTGATSASTWTRTLTAAQKIGMSLSIAASTGDKVNAFGVTILNYSYTKATAPVTYQETDTSGKVITGTTSHTITANVGDVIQVFADQASANAAIAAGTASANLTMVAPSIPGYVLRNSVTTTVLVGSTSVNLVYNRQTAAITVHYQDYSGNTISKDAVLTGSYGDANVNGTTITNPAVPTIAGYTFSATDAKNVPATAINFTAVDANGNVYVTDASGKAITAITLYYKTNATVTLSGTETEGYTGNQQAPKAGNYKITLPTGVTYALKDSDIQLVSGGINAGTYAVKLSTTGINNITAAIGNNYAIDFGTATGSFIIKAADTTVTLSGSETEQYTGAQQAPKAGNYKITLPTGVTYVLKDSDIQLVSGGTNAGTYNVVLSTTGKTAVQAAITAATGTNYNAATFDSAAGTTFVITKAPLTATISSTTKVYDGATVTMPTVAYTVISGSMASPAISWTSSDFEYLASDGQTVVANPTNVGTYTVQFSAAGQAKLTAAQVAGGAAQNYTVTPANGTATITPATATANLTGSQTVPYNGATQSPNASHYNVLLSNGTTYTLKTGDVALVSGSDGKNVGTYTVQLTRTGLTNIAAALTTATDGNYTTVTLGKTSGTFIITPVSATVTLSGTETKTYTGQQLSPSAGNYQVTLPTGVTYTLKDSDIQLVSGGVNRGTYEVTLSSTGKTAIQDAITAASGSNYTVSFDSATAPFIIVSAKASAELSKTNFDYDGTTKASDSTDLYVTIAVNDEAGTTVKVALSKEDVNFTADGMNANTYEFNLNATGLQVANAALSAATNGNYQLAANTATTGSVTINKAKATITIISNDQIMYDGSAHSLQIKVNGAVNGENITYTPVNNSHTKAGQYTVTAIADDNNVNSNYDITVVNGSMTIVKAPITPGEITIGNVNGNELNKTYDGKTFGESPVVQGPEHDVTLTIGDYEYLDTDGNVANDPVNSGGYTIRLTQSGIKAVTDANSDYDLGDLSSLANNATIHKAQAHINITSNDHITYDGAAHSLDTEVIGAVNGETITYTVTNNSHTAVGQYEVTATADSNAVNSNYEITDGSGSMTIVKATTPEGEISIGDVNGNDLDKTYDGKTFDESPVVQGPEKDVTLVSGDYEYLDANGNVVANPTNAGNYTIKLTESGITAVTNANSGYELGDLSSLTNNATIHKAQAQINITSNDHITYDGAAHSLAIEVTGAVNGETITYTVTNNKNTAVGQYDVTATATDNVVNSNYEITNGTGSMTIVKAPTTPGEIVIGDVNGNDLNKTYDGKSFSTDPVVQGPEADVTLEAGDYAYYDQDDKEVANPVNAGEYTIKLTSSGVDKVTAANSNYDLGNLAAVVNKATIQKAKASINVTSNDQITYDGVAHSLAIEVTGVANGETITYTVTNNSHTAVGQYEVTATADSNVVNSNYEITNGTGSMTIVKAPTTPGEIVIGDVNGNDLNKTYDGKTFGGNPVVQGPEKDVTLASGDYEYLDANGNVVANPTNAGNYTVKLTESGITAVTNANSGYELGDLSSLTNNATIHKAQAQINITSNDHITYDGAAHSLDTEVIGAVNGETITYTVTNNKNTAVGQYEVTAIATDNDVNNNYEITNGTGSMTIVKATTPEGEIHIGDVNGYDLNKTYDGKTFTDNSPIVVQGPETDVTLTTGEYAYYDKDGNKVTNPVNAGDYTIKLTDAGIKAVTTVNSNYELGDLTTLVNKAVINKAQASVKVISDENVTYDGDSHSLDIEVTGAVNGETITYTTGNNSHTNVGQYDVTVTVDKNDVNSNYDITVTNGSMTIVKATTPEGEISIGDANGYDLNKTYDGKTFSGNPVVQGPEKDVTLESGDYEYLDTNGNVVESPKNAGDYTIKLTGSGIKAVTDANSNYALGDLTTLVNKATIQKAKASINITSDDTIVYDGDTHSLKTEVTGAVNGETITYTTENNQHANVGQYEVTATADDNAVNRNYEITPGSGSMTIVKAPTTPGEIIIGNVNGNALNKTYDGKTFGESPVVQGPEKDVTLESGDYEYLDAKGNVVKDPINAGDYTIKLTDAGIKAVTTANSSYELGDLSGLMNDVIIRKAPAKINIVSNDKIMYDGNSHSLDIEVTGAVNGETITYTTKNNSHINAGQYDVTATADNNSINSNYEITSGLGSMTITKVPITPGEIIIGNADGEGFSKTYDGQTFSENPVVQGPEKDVTLEAGDYEYVDVEGKVVTNPVNAGEYTIRLTSSGERRVADANSNYDLGDLSQIGNKATISKAKATLTVVSNDNIAYDGKAHSLNVDSKGAVNGETIDYTTENNSQTNVGQYDVTVTAVNNDVNNNYDITLVNGSMTIVKATVPEGEIHIGNAKGENINKTYDGKSFDESPVVQGPEADVTLENGDYEYLDAKGNVVKNPVNAGNYQVKLTASGIDKVKAANNNYDIGDLTTLSNTATINKAKASLTVTSNDKIVYDGKSHSLDVVVDGAVNGETISYITENNSHTNVGQYEVTVTANDNNVNSNYDITVVNGSMTIVKANTGSGEMTTQVKVNDASSNYGEATPTFNITIGSDLKSPDNLTNADFIFVDKSTGKVVEGVLTHVGHYEVSLNTSGKAKVAAANPNYELTDKDFISGTYTINDVITHSKLTVSQTVHYTGAGLRTPADKVQSIIYDVATSKATGKSVYTPESGYAAVDTPEINGFTNSGDVAGYTPETTTVKPIDSTVRVTYTPTNELEYSEITVTRTIHYEGAGDQTPQDVIEKVVYKVVTNKTTGEVSYTPQGIFDAVTTPTLSGYTNSGDVAELIPAATMDKPEDSLVVVQYKKISDGNGNNPEKPTNPGEGGHNPGKPGDNNKPGNGGTTPDNGPDVGTDHSGSPEGVKNSKGSQVKLETLAHLNTKHKKDMTVVKAGILPQTDERHENVISALGMVLLSAFLALFGLKRRKHDDEA